MPLVDFLLLLFFGMCHLQVTSNPYRNNRCGYKHKNSSLILIDKIRIEKNDVDLDNSGEG